MPVIALLGSVASTFGAPQYYMPYGYQLMRNPYSQYQKAPSYNQYQSAPVQPSNPNPYNLAFFNNPYNPIQPAAPKPAVLTRSSANTVNNAPLGLTVDFDSSFGKRKSMVLTFPSEILFEA